MPAEVLKLFLGSLRSSIKLETSPLDGCFRCLFVAFSQRRFPAELFMERYGQVVLLTCCSTLATETDQVAHKLLQQVVREILQLVEVADDPTSHLQVYLETVSR